MEIGFTGEVIHWRGPAPWVFVRLPDDAADEVAAVAEQFSCGSGCLYAQVEIGATRWRTALMPKDGGYLVPVKQAIQRAEQVAVGDQVAVRLDLTD